MLKDQNRKAMFAKINGGKKDAGIITQTGVKFNKPLSFKDSQDLIKQKSKPIPKQQVKDIFNFNKLDESAKERAREWGREVTGESVADWIGNQDGLIYDKKTKIADYDVFENYEKKYWDLDRGQYIQFPDLVIKNQDKLFKMLHMPKELSKKVDLSFDDSRNDNTKLIFNMVPSGEKIDVKYDSLESYNMYAEEDEKLTQNEWNGLEKASDHWDNLMNNAWSSLRNDYDYQFTDEAIDEMLTNNEYEFDEDGNRL